MTASLSFEIYEAPSLEGEALANEIWERLSGFNQEKTGLPCLQEPLVVSIRNPAGDLVGGASAITYWGWLYVKHVWVDASLRGQRIGTQLFDRLETTAKSRGCHAAWLDTFSFQAREFYEKRGYQVLGALEPFPENYCRYIMVKHFAF